MSVKILTDQTKFEELWRQVHATRESSEIIKLTRSLVVGLLMDHSTLIDQLERKGYARETNDGEGENYFKPVKD